jgi:hypothetical protein
MEIGPRLLDTAARCGIQALLLRLLGALQDHLRFRRRLGNIAHLLMPFIVQCGTHFHVHRKALPGLPSAHASHRRHVAVTPKESIETIQIPDTIRLVFARAAKQLA